MVTSTLDKAVDVKDGTNPFYTADSTSPPTPSGVSEVAVVPSQAMKDADSVSGILAVTAVVAGPNKLVATDNTGKLPLSIMPTGSSTAGVIGYVTGTYASLKASPPAQISLGIATDLGPAGTLCFYFNNASVGDNGWIILGGS